ncbi:uncharacterized protein LOC119767630 isoform X2 [Culex quinquefasciatus]|uniref:uncharacterized protein LOC119767630 isoform X2 n=1 Tax=Culex quinquefasciatus TaxID=7176 RepID=UPI0018E3711C|nr:uncharacterized protein LOC119767630 isoform X2 [Culex quinquefasciatus]
MADVYREFNCAVCHEKDIKWSHFVCLVCPEYYLCCKCHEEKHYSKPHRPYHPMQPVLSQQDFFKYVNSVVPPEDDIRLCCPYCGIWILTEAKLLQHCQIKHDGDDDRVRCPVCVTFCILEQSLTFAMFIDHLKKGHCERGRFMFCNTCRKTPILEPYHSCLICNDYDLCENCHKAKKHNQTHMPYHPMQPVLHKKLYAVQKTSSLNIYRCPFCGENEFSAQGLSDHCRELHVESQEIRVRCPICSVNRSPFKKYYLLKDSLLDHLKNYHGILPKGDQPLSNLPI